MSKTISMHLLAFLGALTLATSLPTSSSGFLTARGDVDFRGGIYYCNGMAFKPPCRWQYINPEDRTGQTCVWLRLEGGIASIGPDYGLEVDLFTNSHCDGQPITGPISCPGWLNMDNFASQGFDVKNADAWVKVREVPPD